MPQLWVMDSRVTPQLRNPEPATQSAGAAAALQKKGGPKAAL